MWGFGQQLKLRSQGSISSTQPKQHRKCKTVKRTHLSDKFRKPDCLQETFLSFPTNTSFFKHFHLYFCSFLLAGVTVFSLPNIIGKIPIISQVDVKNFRITFLIYLRRNYLLWQVSNLYLVAFYLFSVFFFELKIVHLYCIGSIIVYN